MNHFKILKEFQGCLSIQLSKICITQTQYLSGVLSLICYRLPRRLVYNIIRYTHCQQLFSIFFKKVVIYFKHTIYSNTFLQFLCIICYKNKNDTLFLMHTSRIKCHFYYRLYLSCLLIFIPGILIFKCIYNRIYSTNYNKPSSWHSCKKNHINKINY